MDQIVMMLSFDNASFWQIRITVSLVGLASESPCLQAGREAHGRGCRFAVAEVVAPSRGSI